MTTPFYSIRSILESKLTPYIAAGIPGVAVHKGITDDVCSYSWGDIFNEMLAQGYVTADGEFYRGRTNQ